MFVKLIETMLQRRWFDILLKQSDRLQVQVEFEFIKKLNENHYCKDWLSIEPHKGVIKVGETRGN